MSAPERAASGVPPLACETGSGSGKVYFLRSGDIVKIGYSRDPTARIKSFKTAIPGELELLGCFDGNFESERQVQNLFADLNVGGEWYRATTGLIEWIESHTSR
jgi:hypothetical protein